MQEEILKLVKAAIEGNTEAQKQIEEILQVAQQPDADPKIVKVAKFIMQMLQPESAKKGCKTKKKPLIPTKKCGEKVKKGGFGLPSKKCSCVLRRVGGTIIEVDSCTGLPFVKKGNKVVKATNGDGTEAWYNTAAATGTGTANQKHYYKEGDVWKVQTWNNGAWGNAEDFDISTLDDTNKPIFYQSAYAAGYDPATGVFKDEASYNDAFNNKNIAKGQNVIKRIGNAEVTINPYLKTDKNTGLQSADGHKVVNARMIGSQKAYINNIKNQIRRTIRYSGLSLKDRIAERRKWGVNVGTKQEGSWFADFKNNMTDASKQTLNYMQALQNNSVIKKADPTPATTYTNTETSATNAIDPIKYKPLEFKTGGKLKIKLK